jgi:cytidylate kinase
LLLFFGFAKILFVGGKMLNITIDGTAGCGKSTLAKELSKSLGVYHFNTGSVYRAIACEYLHAFGEEITQKNIDSLVKNFDMKVFFENDRQVCLLNGHDYQNELRQEKTSVFVPKISPYPQIRELVRKIQRDFAKENSCVMEGRDIGRVVLTDAQFKFFLTADLKVRAERRFKELKGVVSFEDVYKDMKKRDEEDINREEGALIPAQDAIIIDTSDKNVEQTTNLCLQMINTKKSELSYN